MNESLSWTRNHVLVQIQPLIHTCFFFRIYSTFTSQSKEALKKFMESLIAKTGKLRALIRELETKYDDPAATSYMPQQPKPFT